MAYLEMGTNFWQIELQTIVKYGKIGGEGRTIRRTHSSDEAVSVCVLVTVKKNMRC